MYEMYLLCRDYGIKPWEPEGEYYPEDKKTILVLSRLEAEAAKRERNKSTTNQNLSEIFKKK